MTYEVEGVELDLTGLCVMPGLVNAHDHMEFALFPRLGRGPYANATEWAREIHRPEESPIYEHLAVPTHLRLRWGGLRNLLAGVTTVWEHNRWDPVFEDEFPVRVRKCGWAHSLAFEADVRAKWEETPREEPFVIHAAEGTDAEAAREVFLLDELGVLDERTVLVHAVGLNAEGWRLVEERGTGVVWCPRSNLFTLGRTISLAHVPPGVRLRLGTDSPLTAEGDLLDEICAARRRGADGTLLRSMTAAEDSKDWIAAPRFGEPPQLVVIGGRIRLIDPVLGATLPQSLLDEFFPLSVAGRLPVLVRWNVARWFEETRAHLGADLRLGGREVRA